MQRVLITTKFSHDIDQVVAFFYKNVFNSLLCVKWHRESIKSLHGIINFISKNRKMLNECSSFKTHVDYIIVKCHYLQVENGN